ncbi:MAG: sigma-54 dependent transcriptional regulator [Gammaproteobacteria bacterium]
MNAFEELLIGESPELGAVVRAAQLAAVTDVMILILGESGTGKELLAEAVHRESRRGGGPFVPVNCATLPEALAESELFGHRRGAFTGAVADKPGRVQAAAGGTLFLDEVGELPLCLQAKLLRFLESGECHTVGSARASRVNARVIAATNRDLHAEVRAGRFREDLYYRLNVVPLELPPLRERTGDVDLLLGSLTARLARQHNLDAPRYGLEAIERLQRYAWPGNVRELRNFCERMLVLFSGRVVRLENLPLEIRSPAAAGQSNAFRLPDAGIHLGELEADMIRQALSKTRGNRSKAARLLGVSRDALLYRLKKYAIEA